LAAAIGFARARGARVTLLRSVGLPADVPQDFWKTTEQPLIEVLEQNARAYLEKVATTVPAEVFDRTQVVVGAPWQAICDAARESKADLVVIGSHGYGAVDRLLGTTAAKVVNHSPCSVLVVREPHSEAVH
jgi:nucleotide-binding universal stress UspA family protein